MLGEGDALDGEALLGVDGPVDGDGVSDEVIDVVNVLEADDGEVGAREMEFAGILGGPGFSLRRAGPGGTRGVSAIGIELFLGDRFPGCA